MKTVTNLYVIGNNIGRLSRSIECLTKGLLADLLINKILGIKYK